MWISIILCTLLALLCYHFKFKRSAKIYPPGPPGLPIIGNVTHLKPRQFIALSAFGKAYGPVFTVKLLSRHFVVLNTLEAIRSALVDNGNIFALRPPLQAYQSLKRDKGIALSSGLHWKEHRRFALKTLKDFGFSKTIMVNAIHTELQKLIEALGEDNGNPVSTYAFFPKTTTSVICRLVFGSTFSDNEHRFHELLDRVEFIFQKGTSFRYNLFNYLPFLAKIPLFSTVYSKTNYRNQCVLKIAEFIKSIIKENTKTMDRNSEPQNYIDALILHQNMLDRNNRNHFFDEDSMAMNIYDLFLAGTDTSAVTLTWGVLLMAVHPDIQEKLRSEIHEIIGDESLPTMHDISKLNYTLAVVDEINRFSSIAPMAVVHMTSEDVTICDRRIPKDTPILPNIYAVHHDPQLWKYPDTFNPGNFLDDEGAYKASENLIPFSLGKRSCPGESLARMETSVFFVGIMQRFWVTLADRESMNLNELLLGLDGITRQLADHKISFSAS